LTTLRSRNLTYIAPHSGSNSTTGGLGLWTKSLCCSLASLIRGYQPTITRLNLGYYSQGNAVNCFFKHMDSSAMSGRRSRPFL
jgi:hypothetical protein